MVGAGFSNKHSHLDWRQTLFTLKTFYLHLRETFEVNFRSLTCHVYNSYRERQKNVKASIMTFVHLP